MHRGLGALIFLMVIVTSCDALDVPPAGHDGGCTLIGCDSQVLFELDADLVAGAVYEVETCIDRACERAEIQMPAPGVGSAGALTIDPFADSVAVLLPEGDYAGMHTVALTISGTLLGRIEIETEIQFERTQPNGPNCPPVCWQAIVKA